MKNIEINNNRYNGYNTNNEVNQALGRTISLGQPTSRQYVKEVELLGYKITISAETIKKACAILIFAAALAYLDTTYQVGFFDLMMKFADI